MANPDHVALVRGGKDAIAKWRRANAAAGLGLLGLDLEEAHLAGADLSGADLFRANLAGAYLSGAELSEVGLHGASLRSARLVGANLRGATAPMADLSFAQLAGASLTGANLMLANLTRANLASADLGEAYLAMATLNSATLKGANIQGARLGYTALGDIDLSQAVSLATVDHGSPSSVGVDTLIASFRGAGNQLTPDLETFFRGAGVPSELLEALPRIVAEVKYYSCFISYGQPDLQFATRLREDLAAKGVSCWLYEMDKTVGQPTWREIEQNLEKYEKMVVICSIDALMRDGVKKEIDKQIDKSQDKLVPVSLDDRWTQPGFAVQWAGRDLKASLSERNRADFSGWESDPQRYQKALDELLRGLRRRTD